ncbi:hypothetical protein CFC21_091574 [Triticum aestivum]|uniref:Uncharacterized protein n=2 Tax=Triticum aestivum TaxID=4565 RepID=A0A9R1LGQ5_WHEAT|nr:uncharacterized protein LOC123143596 isoform X2 [Triticum aestivum]KAF7088473.1 hypothetical protein CFC21_091574 [Triticum aestivum]
MDPAGPRSAPTDPAGSGAPPPPTAEELSRRAAGSGGGGAAEACGAAPAAQLGDPRVGILESSDKAQGSVHPCNKKDIPQFSAEGATKCAYGVPSLPRTGALLQLEPACLTLGRAPDAVLAGSLHDANPLARGKENIRTDLQPKPDAKRGENRMRDAPLGLDLNRVGSSDAAELNPFFPYKKLGQSKVSDPSECGSTTGAAGESESHRKWREMKQNGFLSSTHGTAVVPKPRGRPPKRKRDDELKRSTSTQNEQTKFTKVAAPSGLLSGLNPGIINHVRNSKQVYSIIKAMVRSEELENASQPGLAGQTGERGKEVIERIQDQKYGDSLMKCHFMMEVTMASDRTCSTLDHESQHDYMTVLSVKAASVASQWLELLQQDIRGRLAALKRSRKRVRNALQTELPHLISTEFSSRQENEPSIAHSSEAGPTGKTASEEHVARWRSLFLQMERTLQEEGRHLEIRLKEVQGMLQNCDKGLKQVTCEAPLLGPMAELWKLKNPEISESEWAVQAAAASIYSTCNLVMKTENVSCF